MLPNIIECVGCYGKGCNDCNTTGRIEITSCARKQITIEVWQILQWVLRFVEQGIAPEPGGGLCQTQSFLDALDFYTAEINYWEDKLGIKRGK